MKLLNSGTLAVCLCASVLSASCTRESASRTVHGQILVITQGGKPIRLEGTPVLLVDSNAAMNHALMARHDPSGAGNLSKQADAAEGEFEVQVSHREALLGNLKGDYASLGGIEDVLGKVAGITKRHTTGEAAQGFTESELEEFRRSLARSEEPTVGEMIKSRYFVVTNIVATQAQLKEITNNIIELDARRTALRLAMQNLIVSNLVRGAWPGTLGTGAVNSRAEFDLGIPAAATNAMIVVEGRGEAMGARQDYLWIVSPPAEPGRLLLLNNANLFQADPIKAR